MKRFPDARRDAPMVDGVLGPMFVGPNADANEDADMMRNLCRIGAEGKKSWPKLLNL
jgi:hypothetical protein